jgi:hypothetical protein
MELFLDKKLTFEKLGMEYRLSEDPNDWPQQILDQLYRQAPYSSDYAPKVTLDQVDSDRRYALGKVELLNKLAINPRDDATPKALKGKSKAVIPVVVKDGKLQPMDLLMHSGEVEPLTEERLRKALFRPTMFEAIKKRPGDISMVEQLYPPQRTGGSGRGGLVADAGGSAKTAEAHPEFLMDAILPTIKKAHVSEVTSRLNTDHTMRAALFSNEVVVPFMAKLAEVEAARRDPETYLQKVAQSIKPNVVQIQKIAGGFRIKTANSEALIPTADDVPRPAAVGTLGGDLVSKVETDGTTTISTQPAIKDTLEDLNIKVVDEFGLYKVKTTGDNKEMVGWVFPKVMDFTGVVLPMAVFSNGSESAMQENIAGVPVARQTDVLDSEPQGLGCFYYSTPSGAQALVPVEIKGEQQTPEGTGYMAETTLGEQCVIVKMPGLRTIEVVADGRYAIPEECGFMPLENPVDLSSSPDEFTKSAEALALSTNAVRVFTDGTCYTFEGKEIDKLAGVMQTQAVSHDDAVFLGAILGQDPVKLAHDLTSLRSKGQYETWFQARPVTPLREKYAAARTRAEKWLGELPDLRADLFKEAAPIEDPTAVDKILSLNFLNAENISIFASYVPEFELTIRKLSELLLAARMGLDAVEQGAVQKAIVHLDKVVNGLKALAAMPQA